MLAYNQYKNKKRLIESNTLGVKAAAQSINFIGDNDYTQKVRIQDFFILTNVFFFQ